MMHVISSEKRNRRLSKKVDWTCDVSSFGLDACLVHWTKI